MIHTFLLNLHYELPQEKAMQSVIKIAEIIDPKEEVICIHLLEEHDQSLKYRDILSEVFSGCQTTEVVLEIGDFTQREKLKTDIEMMALQAKDFKATSHIIVCPTAYILEYLGVKGGTPDLVRQLNIKKGSVVHFNKAEINSL